MGSSWNALCRDIVLHSEGLFKREVVDLEHGIAKFERSETSCVT